MFRSVKNEGIILGGSSAINIAGAVNLAQDMGPNKTIVTILCDHGSRYQSKIYNTKKDENTQNYLIVIRKTCT